MRSIVGKAAEGAQRARYMTLESVAPLSDNPLVSLSAAGA